MMPHGVIWELDEVLRRHRRVGGEAVAGLLGHLAPSSSTARSGIRGAEGPVEPDEVGRQRPEPQAGQRAEPRGVAHRRPGGARVPVEQVLGPVDVHQIGAQRGVPTRRVVHHRDVADVDRGRPQVPRLPVQDGGEPPSEAIRLFW